jgi:Ca2+-binding EF-hand superfamily protein
MLQTTSLTKNGNNQAIHNSHRSLANSIPFSANQTSGTDILSNRMFDHYNRDRSGYLSKRQIVSLIQDAYVGILPQPKTVTDQDIEFFIQMHDLDRDGVVGKEDWNNEVKKYVASISTQIEA